MKTLEEISKFRHADIITGRAGLSRAELELYYKSLEGKQKAHSTRVSQAHLIRRKKKEGVIPKDSTIKSWMSGPLMYDRLVELGIKYDPDAGELYRERESLISDGKGGSGSGNGVTRIRIGRADKSGKSDSLWFTVDNHQYRLGVLAWCLAHKQLVLTGGKGDAQIGEYIGHINKDKTDIRLKNLAIMKNNRVLAEDKRTEKQRRLESIIEDIAKNAGKNKNIVPYGTKGRWAVQMEVFGVMQVLDVCDTYEEAENKERERREIYNASVSISY